MNNSKDDFLVNSILMMGKFYIHKSKYLKVKPDFCAFHKEFVLYTKALKVMKGKNAINLFSIIKEYDLQEKPALSMFLLFCLFASLLSLSAVLVCTCSIYCNLKMF